MTMCKGRVICWDLDETLGHFRPPEDKTQIKRRGLTHGIATLLEELNDLGCIQVLTTASEISYADASLLEFGIRHFFKDIFDRSSICDEMYNKRYIAVINRLDIPTLLAPDQMLIIGNHGKDAPLDLNTVFIHHPYAIFSHAEVLGSIIRNMVRSESWLSAYQHFSFDQESNWSASLSEEYDKETLMMNLSGSQGYHHGIGILSGSGNISSIDRETKSLRSSRSVERIFSINVIPDCFRSEID
jgi:hypothetical protein